MHYEHGEEHVTKILRAWKNRVVPKYRAGQAEHGGKLWRKPVASAITEEIIDLLVYWDVQVDQFFDLHLELVAALQNLSPLHPAYPFVEGALNILATGNREGDMEEDDG